MSSWSPATSWPGSSCPGAATWRRPTRGWLAPACASPRDRSCANWATTPCTWKTSTTGKRRSSRLPSWSRSPSVCPTMRCGATTRAWSGPVTPSPPARPTRRSSKGGGPPWAWGIHHELGWAVPLLVPAAAPGTDGRAQSHRLLGPLDQLRRRWLAERATCGLLRRPGRRRGRSHHHRGALDPSDRLAVRETDPRVPSFGHPGLPEDHRGGPPLRHADLRPDQPQRWTGLWHVELAPGLGAIAGGRSVVP